MRCSGVATPGRHPAATPLGVMPWLLCLLIAGCGSFGRNLQPRQDAGDVRVVVHAKRMIFKHARAWIHGDTLFIEVFRGSQDWSGVALFFRYQLRLKQCDSVQYYEWHSLPGGEGSYRVRLDNLIVAPDIPLASKSSVISGSVHGSGFLIRLPVEIGDKTVVQQLSFSGKFLCAIER